MKQNTFIVLTLLFAALLMASAKPAPKSFDKPPAVGTKATCPVMVDEFTVKKDTPRSEYKGRHYVFCCPACKPKFDANPEKYAK